MTIAQLILLIRNTSPYFFMNELLIALFKQGNQLTSGRKDDWVQRILSHLPQVISGVDQADVVTSITI